MKAKRKRNRRNTRKRATTEILQPHKTRHYFFLNPYDDCAFTKCPKCDAKTYLRKFPLVINIEPEHLLVLNKKCRYCTNCDLIITKKSEVEALMAARFEDAESEILGNEYLVFGTLDKSDWRTFNNTNPHPSEALKQVHVFKDVWKFKVTPGGWYPSSPRTK